MCKQYKFFNNTAGKGEIARNKQFLLFPVFSTSFEIFLPFSSNLKVLPTNSFSLGKGETLLDRALLTTISCKNLTIYLCLHLTQVGWLGDSRAYWHCRYLRGCWELWDRDLIRGGWGWIYHSLSNHVWRPYNRHRDSRACNGARLEYWLSADRLGCCLPQLCSLGWRGRRHPWAHRNNVRRWGSSCKNNLWVWNISLHN